MGTRSVTHVLDRGTRLVSMYRHFDGYLTGHGRALFDFLVARQMTNCFLVGAEPEPGKVFSNSTGHLAAQLVAHFIEKYPRQIYLVGGPDNWQDFDYVVNLDEGSNISVAVFSGDTCIFCGTVEAFGEFCKDDYDFDDLIEVEPTMALPFLEK